MKKIKNIYKSIFLLLLVVACTEDDRDFSYLNTVEIPTDIAVAFNITQDNTGLVTLTPTASAAVKFEVYFGDDTPTPEELIQGEVVDHVYLEGEYDVRVVAFNIKGEVAEITQPLVVSFTAPQNLVVTIENDAAVSKQVNVTATADFATMYDFYTGEPGSTDPISGNIGDTVSHTYTDAGIYTIRVVAKGGAIETTEYTVDFEVTEILEPTVSASVPPTRAVADVISLFSDAYTDVSVDTWNTSWSATSYEEVIIDGNPTKKYAALNFNGIETTSLPIDASAMTHLHIDVWTPNVTALRIKLVDFNGTGYNGNIDNHEAELSFTPTQLGWNSMDIPLEDFSGVPMSDLNQYIISADPSGDAILFVDNVYFYRPASGYASLLSDDFEGNGNITTWTGDGAGLTLNTPNIVNESINTSLSILQYEDTGGQYANVQFTADSKFDLSTGNTVYSLKIYVPSSSVTGSQPNQVSLKLQNSDLGGNSWQTQTEIVKPIVLDTWQELVFNFETDPFINLDGSSPDPVDRTDLDKVVIQVNSENNFDSVTAYIDDFAYGPALPIDSSPFATDDFEGNGTITNWTGDGTAIDTSYANPIDGSIEGMNYSSTVLLYEDTGGQYANAQFTATTKFDLAAKNKFTLKVYVPSSSITGSQPNQISLKLQNSDLGGNSWQTQTEIVKPIVLDAWQEITFDFVNDTFINLDGGSPDPIDRVDLDKVVIQLNSENNFDSVSAYIDDFKYHK